MQIARPPDGFRISLAETVEKMRDAECASRPDFERHWGDLLEYLKMVGHRVGTLEPRLGNGCRLFAREADPEYGTPRIVVGYLPLGRELSIRWMLVSDS